MMRVLSISTLFPSPVRAGFGKFVANQMAALHGLGGVDLVMINPIGLPPFPLRMRQPYRDWSACPPQSEQGGLTVHHPRFTLIPMVGGDSNPARIARAIMPMVRRLHAEKPFDIVDAQFFFPDGPAAAIIARELGVPLTIKARGSDIHYWSGRTKALSQMLDAAGYASALLTVSGALGRDMVALGMDEAKLRIHYTGLDRARFYPRTRIEARRDALDKLNLALPADAPLLVCPGALIAIKGQSLAIDALADLPGAHLALAGTGADEAALRQQAQAYPGRVHFLGQVSHDILPMLMSAADAVVLPSEREGLANVWVEAMACGAPLVIPDIGGAREVVTTPNAGRLVERTPAAIAQAIAEILNSAIPQKDVAAHADRFSWEANAKALRQIWAEAS